MPTRRSRTTALTYVHPNSGHTLLIVIGGEDDEGEPLQTVEILDLTDPSSGWHKAEDIPETVNCSSGTIVTGVIYLLGGWRRNDEPSSAVFKCNVEELILTTKKTAMLSGFGSDFQNYPFIKQHVHRTTDV